MKLSAMRLHYYVSDETILLYYFGDFEIGQKYRSPFRRDPIPSFMIGNYEGRLFWKDFGLTTAAPLDGIGFVQQLKDISREAAISLIWKDIVLGKPDINKKPRSLNIGLPYDLRTTALRDFELVYWQRHCIEVPTLRKYGVLGVTGLYRHGKLLYESTSEEPAYAYMFGTDVFKVYRPLSEAKFRGQNNGEVIEGYRQLPKTAPKLIISSSMKDTMVLNTLGYAACNPGGEANFKAIVSKARELNNRFSDIYILFDNDGPGIRGASRLSHLTGWKPVFLPKELAKDPSDVVKKYGNRFVITETIKKLTI